jgi:hypothetical protein
MVPAVAELGPLLDQETVFEAKAFTAIEERQVCLLQQYLVFEGVYG